VRETVGEGLGALRAIDPELLLFFSGDACECRRIAAPL
jgi:hypothetical protein